MIVDIKEIKEQGEKRIKNYEKLDIKDEEISEVKKRLREYSISDCEILAELSIQLYEDFEELSSLGDIGKTLKNGLENVIFSVCQKIHIVGEESINNFEKQLLKDSSMVSNDINTKIRVEDSVASFSEVKTERIKKIIDIIKKEKELYLEDEKMDESYKDFLESESTKDDESLSILDIDDTKLKISSLDDINLDIIDIELITESNESIEKVDTNNILDDDKK